MHVPLRYAPRYSEVPMLTIERKPLPSGITVLQMNGRITIGRDAQEVEWEVDRLIQQGNSRVVFDLAQVSHMDSTGIGILVLCAGKLKEAGGGLRVACAAGLVDKVLRLTNVNHLVPLDATTDDAAKGLSAGA